MDVVRKAVERGAVDFGWLKSHHSFSFGQYYDPKFMGFSNLRVINDDVVAGDSGFPTHPHQNMEILTYGIEGTISHKDSTGGEGDINAGEIQLMSAGTGISHSEMNRMPHPAKFFQIWIVPDQINTNPGYSQSKIEEIPSMDGLKTLVSPEGEYPVLRIKAPVEVHELTLSLQMKQREFHLKPGRVVWIQGVEGKVNVKTPQGGSYLLDGRDAVGSKTNGKFLFSSDEEVAKVLIFDLPFSE